MSRLIINLNKRLNQYTILDVLKKTSGIYLNGDKYSEVVFDFTNVKVIFPSALATLATLIIDLKKRFNLNSYEIQDDDSPINQYMLRMAFYELFDMDKTYKKKKRQSKNRFTEIHRFNSNSDINNVVSQSNEIINLLISNQDNINVRNALGYCINELIDNAYTHSKAFVCISHSQRLKVPGFSEFSIADNGIGIKETMGTDNIFTALKNCIQKGSKGINSSGKGFGLYSSTEILRKDENTSSFIEIHSENAIIRVNSGQEPIIYKAPFWQGTRVTFHICDYLRTNVNDIIRPDSKIYENGDLNNFSCEEFENFKEIL